MRIRSEKILPGFLLCIFSVCSIILLIYHPALNGEFCSDDSRCITNNTAIKDLAHIERIWQSFNTRFLVGLSFAINYRLGHLDPLGYHIFNLLLHLGCASFVFLLVWLTFETPSLKTSQLRTYRFLIAYFATLIFVTHPVQVQGVAYVTQRFVSMGTFFYLATLLLYVRYRLTQRKIFWWWAIISISLGVFTKELIVTLPLMLLVYEFYFFNPSMESIKRPIKNIWPFFVIAGVVPFILQMDQPDSTLGLKSQWQSFSWDYFWTEINVLRTYLRMLLWPLKLSHSYDYPIAHGLTEYSTILSLLILIGLAGAAVVLFRKERLLSFAIVWFFLTTAVEAIHVCFVQRGVIYDHWLYLPMVGFGVFVSAASCLLLRNHRRVSVCLAGVIIVFSLLAYERSKVWSSCISLWEDVIENSPHDQLPYNNLGVMYSRRGDFEKAIYYYNKAIDLAPASQGIRQAQIYVNLSAVYGRQGDYNREKEISLKAIELYPYNAQAYGNAAMACAALGEGNQALAYFQKALQLNPNDADIYNNLGLLYGNVGNLPEAVKYFQKALILNPDHSLARRNLNLAASYLSKEAQTQ